MSQIHATLNNFFLSPIFNDVFSTFPHEYIFDHKGILRRKEKPNCPSCQCKMNKNGSNKYRKRKFGHIKIGKWICPNCKDTLEEDRSFWEEMKDEVFQAFSHMEMLLRKSHVSYEGASEILSMIYPMGKETLRMMFKSTINAIEISKPEDFFILHYDEQHPKKNRIQKYRLTLLDGKTRHVIADELFDDKSSKTIKKFLQKHLDPKKPMFIVTDFDKRYPGIFDKFFKKGCFHQKCLLHLNKLIITDFKKEKSFESLKLQYEFLNIFYDRSKVIRSLDGILKKEKTKKNKPGYRPWKKRRRKQFFNYVRKLENRYRRRKENLKPRSYEGASRMFLRLKKRFSSFPVFAQKRLLMIQKNWEYLTMFHGFDGAPATNNPIENYYSTSLKTNRKRQYRSDEGIREHMKLSQLHRAGQLEYNGRSLFYLIQRFLPFRDYG